MKKSKSTKPDTVWYQSGLMEGVGILVGECPGDPGKLLIDIQAQIHIKLDAFSDFEVCGVTFAFPAEHVRRVSNAYLYGWIQMQKNLKQHRAELRGKNKK